MYLVTVMASQQATYRRTGLFSFIISKDDGEGMVAGEPYGYGSSSTWTEVRMKVLTNFLFFPNLFVPSL